MNEAVGKSHGKLILMGEHSVVYGEPAIALPLKAVSMRVHLEPAGNISYLNSLLFQGPMREAPRTLDSLVSLLHLLRRDFNYEHYHFMVNIDSTIPIESGMGSSAALSVSMVKAFFNYFNEKLDIETLLHYADFGEQISHGHPSGLDARVTSYNLPLFFQKHQKPEVFRFKTPYWLLIADSGVPGNTKDAVDSVFESYNSRHTLRRLATKETIEQMGDLVREVHHFLSSSKEKAFEDLKHYFKQSQDCLRTLQVSSPELDYAIRLAENFSGGASKLTGGGQGGVYITLVKDKEKGEALSRYLKDQHVAKSTWLMPFSSEEEEF